MCKTKPVSAMEVTSKCSAFSTQLEMEFFKLCKNLFQVLLHWNDSIPAYEENKFHTTVKIK